MRKHRIGKKIFIFGIVFTLLFLNCGSIIPYSHAVDNYSTYLYNQDINVDNDKAHLLAESSDGSNSYRNKFQSNFLFPAKLQNDMLSTFPTPTFNRYSFNQFHFNNLDNNYAYASNNPVDNFEQEIIADYPNVIKGTSNINGSLDNENIQFGKYAGTYTFDEYQETESNLGNYTAFYSFDYTTTSGKYYGTYSFDNDIDGNLPNQWQGSCVVQSEYSGHSKVLKYDNAYGGQRIDNYWDRPSISEIEFWWLIKDKTKNAQINLYQYNPTRQPLYMTVSTGYLKYYNGTNWINVLSLTNDKWEHIRFVFDTSLDVISIYVNGVLIIDSESFYYTCDYIDYLRFEFSEIGYIDGVGYKFDNLYNVGDNYGNYDLQPLKNDFDYAYNPNAYGFISGGYGQVWNVVSNENGHLNVLKLNAITDDSDAQIYLYGFGNLSTSKESGTIEFWFKTTDNTKHLNIHLIQTPWQEATLIQLGIAGKIKYWNGTFGVDICSISNNVWYHIRIDFETGSGGYKELSADSFKIYVNGIGYGAYNFHTAVNNIMFIRLYKPASFSGVSWYFDAIDFSWCLNNKLSRNINPYSQQIQLENNFLVSYNYGNEYYIKYNNDNYKNSLIIIDNEVSDGSITNYFDYKDSGIVEFYFKINTTNTKFRTFLRGGSYNEITIIHTNGYVFAYNSENNIELVTYESNKNYHFKIIWYSDKTFKIYRDNVLIADNFTFRYGLNFINSFLIQGWIGYKSTVNIDNIDYSWTNGYYENRIQDFIPLTDNAYCLYKSSSKLITSYYANVISDIMCDWHYSGTPKWDMVNENKTNLDTGNYIYADDTDDGQSIKFGLSSIDFDITDENQLFNIKMWTNAKMTSTGGTSNDMKAKIITPDKTITLSTFNTPWTTNLWLPYREAEWYIGGEANSVVLNASELADLDVEYVAPTSLTSGKISYIYACYLEIQHIHKDIEIESETQITYNSDYPVLHTLYYSYNTSLNCFIETAIYNYDIGQYFTMSNIDSNNFNMRTFDFNESAYFRLGKFKVKVSMKDSYEYLLFIDCLKLNITYVQQNSNGYQELLVYQYRYDNTETCKGYFLFELQIHKNLIRYRYSEINYYTDDYIYSWLEFNTSAITLTDVELQIHCRYGLNTLDVEILNFYAVIWLNYEYDLELMEQSRKELSSDRLKSSFNYTSLTCNYLNLTGIIGNYSYCCFNGMRSLYGATSEQFHRYFSIPFFSEDIDVSIPFEANPDYASNPDEPDLPSLFYWTYTTFKTVYYQDVNLNVGNWTVQFKQMKSQQYIAKYPYEPKSIDRDDLGSWKWKIKFSDAFSYRVNFNFIRNAVVSVLNLNLLFWQWIGFMGTAGVSYLFMFIGCSIMVFLWNVMVYYLFYALIYILWYLYLGLYMLLLTIWEGLEWVWLNLLIPFYVWFSTVAIPYLVEYVIIPAVAFTLTLIIWIITLGRLDFWELYAVIHDSLILTADIFIDIVQELIEHIVEVVLFIGLYLLLILLCFLKHIVVKARGFVSRAQALRESYEAYLYPIEKGYEIAKRIKELLANWM